MADARKITAGGTNWRFLNELKRGWETERCRMAQATALILDST